MKTKEIIIRRLVICGIKQLLQHTKDIHQVGLSLTVYKILYVEVS